MKSLQRRAAVGAVLVIGIGLAFLLRNLGMGIGTGNGNDAGTVANIQSNSSPVKADIVGDMAPEKTEPSTNTTSKEEAVVLPDTSQLVTLIVEEKHYLLGTNSTPPKSVKKIELANALEIIKQAKGNEQGIRCRIFYLGSSLPSAETELNNQLKELGLEQSEIYIEQRVLDLK